jgi:hypothetical protein
VLHRRRLATADIARNKAFDPPGIKAAVILYILLCAFASNYEVACSFAPSKIHNLLTRKKETCMKVTSDRIKERAFQLRKEGFKLSGSMVRRTLELNAGARTQLSSKEKEATIPEEALEHAADGPKNTEAA